MSWEKDMQALDDILAEANRDKYEAWIVEHVAGDGYGQCEEVTRRMAEAFPELTRVRGHYYCWAWGERAHWWLTDGENVVDPTARQFPSKGKGDYVPLEEGAPEPIGMCPNCGDPCYDGSTCCSESCAQAYVAYCMNPN